MSKLKVALCMRGAISKDIHFLNSGDLYKESKYIDYVKCYDSIVKHIIQPNENDYEFSTFCHCWNVELEEELTKLYNPCKKVFEDNTSYNDEISSLCKTPIDFGGISQALTIKKAIELKEQYEFENCLEYDIVILYRYDVLLWKDIILSNYLYLDKNIYVNGHVDSNGDFRFIMNNNNSNLFKNLYDSIKLGNEHRVHHWIKNYVINYLKIELIMDDITPGVYQEVLRKML
jgi:hypothetical protein